MNQYKWPLMKNTITIKDKFNLIKFIISTDRFTNGPMVRKFESEWSKWLDPTGKTKSLFVSSGSTANFLLVAGIMERYGLKPGDKVIVPACTWVTNISPIIQLGLKPIFCDINLFNFSFSITHLKKIANEHKDIKAMFITYLLGFDAELEKYKEIFPDILYFEDICESHGVTDIFGTKRGTQTIGSTFSFYFGHHMTTIEGGMISVQDDELYEILRAKRSHGLAREMSPSLFEKIKAKYANLPSQFLFITDGYNFRNTDLAAVLGLSQLKRLDSMIEKRRDNFDRYIALLSKYENLFHIPNVSSTNSSFSFPFVAKDKRTYFLLKEEFEKAGIEIRPIVGGNLLKQPFLKDYQLGLDDPIVDTLHENGIYIGNNHFVSNKEFSILEETLAKVAYSA